MGAIIGLLYLIVQYFWVSFREVLFDSIDMIGLIMIIAQYSSIGSITFLYLSDLIGLFEFIVFFPRPVQKLLLPSSNLIDPFELFFFYLSISLKAYVTLKRYYRATKYLNVSI